jgi:hypothetical protein
MGYSTLFEEGSEDNISYINTFVVFFTTFASGLLLSYYGINNGNNSLAAMGLLFMVLSLSGPWLISRVGGNFFTPDISVEKACFVFWATAITVSIGGQIKLLEGIIYSGFIPAGETYAASALAGEVEAVKTLAVNFLSVNGENIGFTGMAVLFLAYTTQRFGEGIKGLVFGLAPLAFTFLGIHTDKIAGEAVMFAASAAFFITSLIAVYVGSELELDIPLEETALGTMAGFGGTHFGINAANTHGLIGIFIGQPHGILNVPYPELQFLAYGITAIYGISLLYAFKFVGMQFYGE